MNSVSNWSSTNNRGRNSANRMNRGSNDRSRNCTNSLNRGSNNRCRHSADRLNRGVDSLDSVSDMISSDNRGRNSADGLDGGVDSVDSMSNGSSSNKTVSDVTSMGDHSSMSVGDHVGGDVRVGSSRGHG